MVIKIEMLRCFATVAECGNLQDAASRLGRSQSAVSAMLKRLEEHLENPLFETDRKNVLSPVGTFVFEQAQIELRQFDRTVQAIESFARAEIGMVRVAAVPSVAATILPRAIEKFLASRPNVQIDLRDMDSASVLNALAQDRVDIGIATVSGREQDARCTPLFADPFGLVCSRDHPLAARQGPIGWDEFEGVPFLANELCGVIRAEAFQAIYRRANLHVHNVVSLLALVKGGMGVTVLPKLVVQLDPLDVVFKPLGDARALRHIDLLHRSPNTMSPVAEVLGQHITAISGTILEEIETRQPPARNSLPPV